MHYGWFWFAFALIAGIAEVLLPSFFMIFLSISAALPLILAITGVGLSWQIASFGVALTLCLLVLRPRFVTRLQARHPQLPSRAEIHLGKFGKVSVAIDPTLGCGRIEIEGEDWAAQSPDAITKGRTVKVVGSDGIILKVVDSDNSKLS